VTSSSPQDVFFNKRGFFLSLLRGTYQSICCFFIPYAATGMGKCPSAAVRRQLETA
jgi:hypothetical protein